MLRFVLLPVMAAFASNDRFSVLHLHAVQLDSAMLLSLR